MAKLGSKKRPLILRVSSEERMHEVVSICNEHDWSFIVGFEEDQIEDVQDLEKKPNPPTQHVSSKLGRNSLCYCGSQKKTQELLFEGWVNAVIFYRKLRTLK